MTEISEIARDERRRMDEEREGILASIHINTPADDTSPDDAAAITRANELGGPTFSSRAEADAAIRAYQNNDALATSPRLRRWLANPENAMLARDDVQPLSFLELLTMDRRASLLQSTSQFARSGYGRAISQSQRDIELGRLSNRQNPMRVRLNDDLGPLSESERERLNYLRRAPRYQADGWGEEVAGQLPILLGSLDAMGRKMIQDARSTWRESMGTQGINERNWAAYSVLTPFAAIASATAGAGGFIRGGPGFMYEQEAGAAFEEYRNYVDRDGNRIDPMIAGRYANQVGMINAGIEFASLATGAKILGIDKIAEYFVRGGVRDALRRYGLGQIARRAVVRSAGGAINEGFTEGLQEWNTIHLGQLAQQAQGGEWEGLTDEEIAARIWDSARVGATVGAVMGSVPVGIGVAQDIEQMGQARLQQELFSALHEGVLSSKTRERSPQSFANAVDTLTRNGPLEEVNVDARRFEAFYQERDQDPMEQADRLKGVGREALQAALDRGGEITIPMSTYANQIVGTESEALSEHVRLGPDKLTPAEVRARFELGVDIQKATSEAVRLQAEAAKQAVQEDAIYQRLLSQFDESETFVQQVNKDLARWLSTSIITQAKAGGIDPEVLLNRMGLDVNGPFGSSSVTNDVADILARIDNSDPQQIPRNLFARDRVRVAMPRSIPRRVTQATEPGVVDGLNYGAGDYLVSEDRDGATPWVVGQDIYRNTYVDLGEGRGAKRSDQPVGYYVVGAPTTIQTLEGPRAANTGDVVMIGAKGEMWPVTREEFDARYDTDRAGYDQIKVHPTILKFGTESEVRSLLDLVSVGASADEILSHPIYKAISDLADAGPQGMPTFEQLSDPEWLAQREYVDPATGDTINFREAVDRLKEQWSESGVRYENKAIIVTGYSGAGKSTVSTPLAREVGAADTDLDLAKTFIPDYQGGINSMAVTPEARILYQVALEELIDAGANVIIPKGGYDLAFVNIARSLSIKNYSVSLSFVDVQFDEAVRRATSRFVATGRYLDPAFMRMTREANPASVYSKAIERFDWQEYMRVDVNGPKGVLEVDSPKAGELADALGRSSRNARAAQGRAQSGGNVGAIGFNQTDHQTQTEAFKSWFKESRVVDDNGDPLVVYTGTTGDFDVFDREKANPESDLGAGFYFTNTLEDLESNYAGMGPDLTQKIQLEAERIAGETGGNYDDPEVVAQARSQWVQHDGVSMPVYLSFQNPVIIGGRGETRLDFDEGFDPETEEYADEPSGKLWEFIQALRSEASRAYDGEVDGAIDKIMEQSYEDVSAREIIEILKADGQFGYHTDENGKLISNEIVRRAFERIGFDGYIDRTVNQKFGSERKLDKPMAGMHEGTVHYIAFRPEQIKSAIGNSGDYDPNNPSVLYQDDTPTVPPLYSALLRAVEALPANTSMTGQEWLDRVLYEPERVVKSARRDPATNKPMIGVDGQTVIDERTIPRRIRLQGVKQEEIDWTGPLGLVEWLQSQEGQISQRDVASFIAANGVQVRQTVLGEMPDGASGRLAELQRISLPLIEEHERLNRRQGDLSARIHSLNEADALSPDEKKEYSSNAKRMGEITALLAPINREQYELSNPSRTKWSTYVTPGGSNYRELLLTLPESDRLVSQWEIIESDPHNFIATRKIDNGGESYTFSTRSEAERFVARQKEKTLRNPSDFQSSHWNQANVIVHVRFNERVDIDGKRTLFIEELQSDWHQQGRERGYKGGPAYQAIAQKLRALGASDADLATILTQGQWPKGIAEMIFDNLSKEEIEVLRVETGSQRVPDAPFKNNLWAALGIKAVMRIAVEGGFDQISWIEGQAAVERFSLDRHIQDLSYDTSTNFLHARDLNGRDSFTEQVDPEKLDEYIGAELAKRIRDEIASREYDKSEWSIESGKDHGESGYVIVNPNGDLMHAYGGGLETFETKASANEWIQNQFDENPIRIEGLDLRVGGEGMRAFYDQILPNIVNGIVKGERADKTKVFDSERPWPLIAVDENGKTITGGMTREEIDRQLAKTSLEYDIRADDSNQVEAHRIAISDQLRERVVSDGLPLFQGTKKKGPQGQIAFSRDAAGLIKRAMVRFYETRNLSTPIHEIGGHLFLETLRLIANEPTATAQAKADWATVLEWFGVADEDWTKWSLLPERAGVDKMRPYHEKFARGFEVFVMEGKSPSLALKAIFGRFKHWMISIYKTLQGIPNAPVLTPEIRAVFARLQATQEEIDQANDASGGADVMTREQFGPLNNKFVEKNYQRYLQTIDLARAEAEAAVEREAIGALMADQERWWRGEERKVRPAARIDVANRPEWVARDWMGGERIPANQDPIRLNPALAVEEYGAELIDRLPPGIVIRDAESMTAQALGTRKILNQTAPKRMAEVIADIGGISTLDPNAKDAAQIIGTDGAVPVRGKMKRKLMSETGLMLDGNDGLIQRLWEEGFFGAKPTRGFMQLAGRNAVTADKTQLERARAMYGSIWNGTEREFREHIWRETGWAVGDDGKWRFEIDTAQARLTIGELSLVRESPILRLDEVLDFPALFEAYPQLREVPTDIARGKYGGMWLRRERQINDPTVDTSDPLTQVPLIWVPLIRVRAGNNASALSILLHEIQHAIQDIENFATGGNPTDALTEHPTIARDMIEKIAQERVAKWRGTAWAHMVFNNDEEKMLHHERLSASATVGWDIYERLAGEVEARDVQARIHMTPEERAITPPGEYYPLDSQSVRRPDRIVSMSKPEDSFAAFNQEDGDTENRPTVQEFLDRLAADLRGEHIYSVDDLEAVAQINDAQRVKDWFAERGVDLGAKPAEIRKQIEQAITQLSDEGADADTIASMVNGVVGFTAFDSGQAMLEVMANLPTFDAAVSAEVKKRMQDKFGDPLRDGTVQELARGAVHNALAEKKIEIELDAMSRAVGGRVQPVNAAAKLMAKEQVERATVKQVRGYNWYLGNERRHAKQAFDLSQRGDKVGASQAKFRQLVNFQLFRLARDASSEMESARRYFRKFEKLAIRTKISPDYIEQIDQLLEQYELRQISGPEAQRRMSMAAWIRSMEERGLAHLINIDPVIMERANRMPFDSLSVAEARALIDAVKNIEHLGRLKDKLLDAADQRSFDAVITDAIAAMEATGPIGNDVRRNYSGSDVEKMSDRARRAHAELTRMEFLFRYLDGQHNGPIWRALWLPFAKAADKESVMMHNAARQMTAVWDRYSRSERARMFKTRYQVDALGVKGPNGRATSFTRAELIAIALNVGNGGNVAALVDGFGWFEDPVKTDYDVAKAKIIAELDTVLTQRDWETVQAIWKIVGQFRDEAFQLQEDLTGLKPEAVEAESFSTRYGDFEGGYYPLKFDRSRDLRVEKADTKQEVQELYGSNWTAPMTRKGHLINRVGSGGRPVKLSLTVFTEHVQNVVHDVSYRRAVIDVNRIVGDSRFAESFIHVAGRETYDQLAPWLQAIASDRVDPSAFMWKFLQKLRGNTAIAAMGYRLSTALTQLTGILQAVPMLGGPEIATMLAKIFSRPDLLVEKSRFILTRSEFMRSRVQTFDRDVRENLERMERDSVTYPVQKNAFMLVGMFDWAVSSVVWLTAYDKARGGKVDGIDPMDEEAAIRFGDSAVRTTQSAGLAQDLPAVMRGSQVNKLLTMFYSYFSVLYNWTSYDQIMNARKGRLPVHVFIGNMALIYIVAPLITEALAGRWGQRDDEDDDEYKMRLASIVVRAPFMTIPVARDIASAMGSYFEYQLSPVQSGPAKIVEALEDAVQGRTFSSESSGKTAALALGYTFGLPTPQAWVTVDYVADQLEGEETGFDPVEAFMRDTR